MGRTMNQGMTVEELIEKLNAQTGRDEVAIRDARGLYYHVYGVEDVTDGSVEGFTGIAVVVGPRI